MTTALPGTRGGSVRHDPCTVHAPSTRCELGRPDLPNPIMERAAGRLRTEARARQRQTAATIVTRMGGDAGSGDSGRWRMRRRVERGRPKGGPPSRHFRSCPSSRDLGSRNQVPSRAMKGLMRCSKAPPATRPIASDRLFLSFRCRKGATSMACRHAFASFHVSTINVAIAPARFTASCAWRGVGRTALFP